MQCDLANWGVCMNASNHWDCEQENLRETVETCQIFLMEPLVKKRAIVSCLSYSAIVSRFLKTLH